MWSSCDLMVIKYWHFWVVDWDGHQPKAWLGLYFTSWEEDSTIKYARSFNPTFMYLCFISFIGTWSWTSKWRTKNRTSTGRRRADGVATRRVTTLSLGSGHPHTSPTSPSRASSSCDVPWTQVSEENQWKHEHVIIFKERKSLSNSVLNLYSKYCIFYHVNLLYAVIQ